MIPTLVVYAKGVNSCHELYLIVRVTTGSTNTERNPMSEATRPPLPFPTISHSGPGIGDVALILRADGSMDVYAPDITMHDDGGVEFGEAEVRVIPMMALGALFHEPGLMEASATRVMTYLTDHSEAQADG